MINKSLKGVSALVFALVLIFGSITVCFAEAAYSTDQYVIDDKAQVLTRDMDALAEKLKEASEKTGWQLIVYTDNDKVTADSLKDYYEDNYYKTGDFKSDSVVLVMNTATNKGTFFANGDASYYINDDRVSETGKLLRPDMDAQDYYQAATDFADKMVEYHNNPTAEVEKKNGKLGYVLKHYWWAFALIAIVAGGLTFGITAGKYKYNGRFNTYDLKSNSSTMLTEQYDTFVTKHTTSRTIQQNDSSSSGGSSGGSRGGDF